MNNNVLVLITSEDPLNPSFNFVRGEVEVISSMYKHIYIFSERRNNVKPTITHDDCEVIGLNMDKPFRFIRFILKGLFVSKKSINDDENPASLKKKLFRLYEKGKTSYMYKKIKRFLDSRLKADDHLIFYSYWLLNTATTAVLLKRNYSSNGLKTLCISRTHGYDLYSERNALNYLPLQKFNVFNLDYVYPCSDNGVLYLNKKYVECSKKIILSRLGTKDFGIEDYQPSNVSTFVTCSRLIPLKRVELFAEAFAKLQKERDIYWSCFGDGPNKESIIKILKDNNVKDDRYTLFGNVSNKEVLNYYKENKVDYLVNVSEYEGVPVTIMEAMSFGIPVIATSVGGTPEIVNNENGVLISSDINGDELYSVLKEAIDNYQIEKRKEARLNWEKTSNCEHNYQEFHKNLLTYFN